MLFTDVSHNGTSRSYGHVSFAYARTFSVDDYLYSVVSDIFYPSASPKVFRPLTYVLINFLVSSKVDTLK